MEMYAVPPPNLTRYDYCTTTTNSMKITQLIQRMDGKDVCSTKKTDTQLHTGITVLYKADVQFELWFSPVFYVGHLMCVSTQHMLINMVVHEDDH